MHSPIIRQEPLLFPNLTEFDLLHIYQFATNSLTKTYAISQEPFINSMSTCSDYLTVKKTDFILAWVLTVGIYISFVPQHVKVIKRRTSEGLSPSYLLMGSISAFASFVNMYLVTVPARHCCTHTLNAYQCANAMSGYVQVGVQAIGYCLIIVLCVYLTKNSPNQSAHEYKLIYRYFLFFVLYVVICFIACIVIVHAPGQQRARVPFADFSGVLSTILQVLQYIPQLWTTFKLSEPGSLSIPSMVIQVPGTFYWAYSLYDDPASKWSSYVPFFAAASLQAILLLLCIYYKIYHRIEKARQQPLRPADVENTQNNANSTSVNVHHDSPNATSNSIQLDNTPSGHTEQEPVTSVTLEQVPSSSVQATLSLDATSLHHQTN